MEKGTNLPPPLRSHVIQVFQQFLSTDVIRRFEAMSYAGELISTQREMVESLYRAMVSSVQGIGATGHRCVAISAAAWLSAGKCRLAILPATSRLCLPCCLCAKLR